MVLQIFRGPLLYTSPRIIILDWMYYLPFFGTPLP